MLENKLFKIYQADEEAKMQSFILANLMKLWEINIERFSDGSMILKYRLKQE